MTAAILAKGPGSGGAGTGPGRLPAELVAELATQTFLHAVRQAARHTTLTAAAGTEARADARGIWGSRGPHGQAAAASSPACLSGAGEEVIPTNVLPGRAVASPGTGGPAGPQHAADVRLSRAAASAREAHTTDEVRADVTGQATATPGHHSPTGRRSPDHGLSASGREADREGSSSASLWLRSYRRVALAWSLALVVVFAFVVAMDGGAIAGLGLGLLYLWQALLATPKSLWPRGAR